MLINTNLIILFVASIFISWVATALIRRVAIRLKVLDTPDSDRKIHSSPTPLLGGLAIYLSLLVVSAGLYFFNYIPDFKVSTSVLGGFFISGLLLMIGGFLDDKFNLRWFQSIAFPILACLTVIYFGLEVNYITNPLGGLLFLDNWPLLLSTGLVFLWLMGMIYTTKLLDGLDGLASSIGFIASIVIFVVSLFWDDRGSTTTYLSLSFAGILLGFLFWNWHPAKIFLGEGGSTFLGFTLGVLAILTGGKFATAMLVMGVPILDVVWTILRRLTSTRKLAMADTGHLHFRLLKLGLSQPQVVIFMSTVALLFGSVSFFTSTGGKVLALVVLAALMIILGRFVVLKQRKHEN